MPADACSKKPYQDDWEVLSNCSSLVVEPATSTRHPSPEPLPGSPAASRIQPLTSFNATPVPPSPWPIDARTPPPEVSRDPKAHEPAPRAPTSPSLVVSSRPCQIRKRAFDELEVELEVISFESDNQALTPTNRPAPHETTRTNLDGNGADGADVGTGVPLARGQSASSAPTPQGDTPDPWSWGASFKAAGPHRLMNKPAGEGPEAPSPSKRRKV